MFEALNQTLYGKLRTRFGRVRVANPGEALVGEYRPNVTGRDRDDFVVDHPGEYYQVCCPKCHDTKHRLWINHRWGVKDQKGNRNLHLAVCYNEGCYAHYQERIDLLEDLNQVGGGGSLERATVQQGEEIDFANIEVALPGHHELLHELPPHHPANAYLAGRGYDPEKLGRFYGVGYCNHSPMLLAANRIVVPIYVEGKLKGWQARYIGDMDWHDPNSPPKWYFMPRFKKGQTFYNIDAAKTFETGVVVEGCGDAWGFGPMSLATFGQTMTVTQKRLLKSIYANRSVVLLWDPEAMDPMGWLAREDAAGREVKPTKRTSMERRKEKLDDLFDELSSSFKHGFAPIKLPWGSDPGSLDRAYLREYVRKEAKALGVKVSWKRR